MKLLKKERGLTRIGAILFGLRWRAASIGWARSIAKCVYILLADSLRTSLQLTLKVSLLYPIRLIKKSMQMMTSPFKRKTTNSQATEI
jgi:hypothetical protein